MSEGGTGSWDGESSRKDGDVKFWTDNAGHLFRETLKGRSLNGKRQRGVMIGYRGGGTADNSRPMGAKKPGRFSPGW